MQWPNPGDAFHVHSQPVHATSLTTSPTWFPRHTIFATLTEKAVATQPPAGTQRSIALWQRIRSLGSSAGQWAAGLACSASASSTGGEAAAGLVRSRSRLFSCASAVHLLLVALSLICTLRSCSLHPTMSSRSVRVLVLRIIHLAGPRTVWRKGMVLLP